ncbi:hypothetical protein [uncultured Thiodictyon sp.]|uniref:hypothetical protein n=1 Tax=uncultured Thiodictyon sp. TaxID=1846217 RepID=UPI0025E89BA9|nr:hypothetical protein [uncultured Thiodictyon sp.]
MSKPIERRIKALEARDPGNRVVVLFAPPTDEEAAEYLRQGARLMMVKFVEGAKDLEQQP